MLGCFSHASTVFDMNVFIFDELMGVFYSKTMESFLSTIIRNHVCGVLWRKIEWVNVRSVEWMLQGRRSLGKWLGAQTKWANVCNWKSGFLNAPNAKLLSAKY